MDVWCLLLASDGVLAKVRCPSLRMDWICCSTDTDAGGVEVLNQPARQLSYVHCHLAVIVTVVSCA